MAIVAVAAAVRVALLLSADLSTVVTPDSEDYLQLAWSLAEHGEFARGGEPEIFRTPGYPLLLMLTAGGGTDSPFAAAPPSWQAVAFVQILLDILLVLVVYLLGRLAASQRVGLWAAGLQAVSPLVLAASVRLLSDSLYALLFTLAVLLMVGHLRTRRTWALVGAGVLLGLAAYVRPVGLAMALPFALAVWIGGRQSRSASRKPGGIPPTQSGGLGKTEDAAKTGSVGKTEDVGKTRGVGGRVGARVSRASGWYDAGVFALVLLAVVGPWIVRNAVVADYRGFSSFGSDAVYYFAAGEVVARTEGLSGEEARERLRDAYADWRAGHPDATVGEAARWRARRGREILLEHPSLYARLHLGGSLGIWLPGATDVLEVAGLTEGSRDTHEVLVREGLWAAVRHYFGGNSAAIALAVPMVLLLALKYAAIVFLLLAAVRERLRTQVGTPTLVLLVGIVLLTAVLPGPFGLPRYRLPIEPILHLAAAAGLLRLLSWRRRYHDATRGAL